MPTREYYHKNQEAQRTYNRAYYARTQERRVEVQAACYKKHNVAIRERRRLWGQRLRLEVLTHYGGKCTCCGEPQLEFLVLDHINGGGSQHRREVGGGTPYYQWIKKNDYPSGYRILCSNCNSSLGHYGYCPHVAQEVL